MPETHSPRRLGVGRPRIVVPAALLALVLCTAVPIPAAASPAQPATDAWARLSDWLGGLWVATPWAGAAGHPGELDRRYGASFGGTGGGDTGLGLDPDGTDPDPTPTGDPNPTPTPTGLTTSGPASGTPSLLPAARLRGRI